MPDFATLPQRRGVQSAQTIDGVRSHAGLSTLQIRRIVARLEDGQGERNIAESEHIAERIVRRVRQLELDRRARQMAAVGTAVGSFLDQVSHLHRDIDESVFEELREGAA